jgi:DNA-binding HxlR family transcriptional regulator
MECSVARTLEVVGERWSLLILRNAFYGVRRFEDFQRGLGIARNVLTDRLATLVEHGVFERQRYADRPPRHEYRLTEKGRDLLPVVLAMMRWGDRWSCEGEPPVRLTHTTCGEVTTPQVTCDRCGDPLDLRTIVADPITIAGASPADASMAGTD